MKLKNKNILFLSLICSLLIIRLPVVLSSRSFMLEYLNSLTVGLISKEILSNNIHMYLSRLRAPFPSLVLFHYLSYIGVVTLPINIISLPFFLLFGESLFSFRLVTLFFSLGIFSLWYKFIFTYFNERVALFSSLLFIFSPPFFVEAGLETNGYHFAATFFLILTLLGFYKIIFSKEFYKKKSTSTGIFILFGLTCGFSLYFNYTFFLPLAIYIFIMAILVSSGLHLFSKNNFLAFILSFLLGFSPWIYLKMHGHLLTYKRLIEKFPGTGYLSLLPLKLKTIFFQILPSIFYFDNIKFLKGNLLGWIYYSFFIISFFYLAWTERKRLISLICYIVSFGHIKKKSEELISKATFFIIYTLVFFLVLYSYLKIKKTLLSFPLSRDPRLAWYWSKLSSLFPISFLTIAISLNKIWFYKKKVALLLLATLIFFGVWSNFKLVDFKNFDMSLSHKGYSYMFYGWVFNPAKINEPYRKSAYFGYGDICMLKIQSDKDDFAKIIEILDKIDESYRPFFIAGLGFGTLDNEIIVQSHDFNQLCIKINNLLYNLGFFEKVFAQYNEREKYKRYFCQGILIGVKLLFGDQKVNEVVHRVDEKIKPFFYKEKNENQIRDILYEVF